MNEYELTDYQGNKIILPADKASKVASVAGLIEVEVDGFTHFISPSNIASILPAITEEEKFKIKQIEWAKASKEKKNGKS